MTYRSGQSELKELEQETTAVKKVVAELALHNAILKEAGTGKLLSPSRRRQIVQQGLAES